MVQTPPAQPEQPFILGVNYWPRRKAMYWWSQFEAGEVAEEFSLIATLGLTLVRIFLLWEDWQPEPDRVDPQALKNLGIVCDTAANLGLQLDVTFFTGHMSGPSWTPPWMLHRDRPMLPGVRQVVSGGEDVACGYANPFTDAVALDAEALLLKTVVSCFKDHPAIGLWNLGNEPDLFAQPQDAAAGRAWVRRWRALIGEIDPLHPVTCGLHTPSLVDDNGLPVHQVFAETDLAVMHGYPMYADWARGPLDPDFVPFLCMLTSALCGKPTLMEEFGGPTTAPGEPAAVWEWARHGKPYRQYAPSEAGLSAYVEGVLPRLVEVGATGALLWCFADYIPELYDRPPCNGAWHERFFGLVRPDGSLKPHAETLQRFAATRPTVQPASRRVDLDQTPEEYYRAPLENAKRLYARYLGE